MGKTHTEFRRELPDTDPPGLVPIVTPLSTRNAERIGTLTRKLERLGQDHADFAEIVNEVIAEIRNLLTGAEAERTAMVARYDHRLDYMQTQIDILRGQAATRH